MLTIAVSVGEAVDKYCILEIKQRRIANNTEIVKEIALLAGVRKYIDANPLFYRLLTYVNEYIWDQTNRIKLLSITDPLFVESANSIFEYNQKRFRIKSWFESDIKEQKSYTAKKCIVHIDDVLHNKIPELFQLALDHDIVYFITNNDADSNIVRTLCPMFRVGKPNNLIPVVQLSECEYLDAKIRPIFEPEPILYLSGGLLGDFIHQLSVVKEIFFKTGRKGCLFISNEVGDRFAHGVETAYKDTFDIIIRQPYIKSYIMVSLRELQTEYKNTTFTMLSNWRGCNLVYKGTWYDIFKSVFSVEWGKTRWIENIPVDSIWKDKVLLNYTRKRSVVASELKRIYELYGESLVFMSFDKADYDSCISILDGKNIPFYKPATLYDMCVCINSCKTFIGGLSMPLTISFALHKDCVVLRPAPDSVSGGRYSLDFIHFNGLERRLPFMRLIES
jgi:hypothetical protein